MDIHFEEAEADEIQEPGEKTSLLQRIDEESLIDILQISTESWSSLIDDEDPVKLQSYYIDVALYNRKLELFKMGYFDIFEPPDERLFKDSLALSAESRMRIEVSRDLLPPVMNEEFEKKTKSECDGEDNEISNKGFQCAGLQWLMQSVMSLLSSARECLSS